MSVRITARIGRYDFCSTDKHCSVNLSLPDGAPQRNLSQMWAVDDEPDVSGMLPSEVVEILSERMESLLFSSSRAADRETVAWCRAHAEELNAEWANDEIARLVRQRERLADRIAELERILDTRHTPPAPV